MRKVKVTVKREQINKSLWAGAKASTQVHRGSGSIYYTEDFPEEITLELPVGQIDIGPVLPSPNPSTCAHDFDEIELGGMGKIKRCRICGTARGVKRETKRKRFKVHHENYAGAVHGGDVIELEEVE